MFSRLILTVIALGASGGVAIAQTPVAIQIPAEDQSKVQTFEASLRAAIVSAGGQLAKRAREVVQDIVLQFESEARIQGLFLPDGEGLQFFIDVPGIQPGAAAMWQLGRVINDRRDTLNAANPGGTGTARVGAPATTTTPDPNSVLMTDPIAEYSRFTHDALVDTMLDNAFALPIKPGQTLTLIVGNGTVGLPRNPLAPPEKLLFLRIKGEDLLALRQNTITRDEAKKRIRQWAY